MRFQSFDPTHCHFPRPRVPVLPTLSRHSLSWRGSPAAKALTTAPNARFFTRGRYALTEAYRLCGVGPNRPLLAPSYHCRTMLDPAITQGAPVILYPVTHELRPDLAGLAACIAASPTRPAALLLTHYFGFPQAMDDLLLLCREAGIALIEDCGHCLFLPGESQRIGLQGQYCISSPYKFFPIEDGGVLWANSEAALPAEPLETQGMAMEIKGTVRTLQQAMARAPTNDAGQYANDADPVTPYSKGEDPMHDSDAPSTHYKAASERAQSLKLSRLLMRHTDTKRLARMRRSNYLDWLDSVGRLPNCKPLFAELPQNAVPYMFPLRIAQPEKHFYQLKRLGMPVWRWDDMAVSGCETARDFRTHLLHLPCHQELTSQQMRWMTSTVADVLTGKIMGGTA